MYRYHLTPLRRNRFLRHFHIEHRTPDVARSRLGNSDGQPGARTWGAHARGHGAALAHARSPDDVGVRRILRLRVPARCSRPRAPARRGRLRGCAGMLARVVLARVLGDLGADLLFPPKKKIRIRVSTLHARTLDRVLVSPRAQPPRRARGRPREHRAGLARVGSAASFDGGDRRRAVVLRLGPPDGVAEASGPVDPPFRSSALQKSLPNPKPTVR